MNYLNDYAIDGLATRIVNAYLRCEAVPRDRLDPVMLCEKVLKLRVKHLHLSQDRDILGITSFGEAPANYIDDEGDFTLYPLDGSTVLIESELYDNPCGCGRYNFTVAHEASHHILNRIGQTGGGNAKKLIIHRSSGSAAAEFDEWQTDRLAAALLMNKPMLYAAMKKTGIAGGITVLDNALRNEEWLAFCETAEILGVSPRALERRMSTLRLIEHDYYTTEKKRGSIFDVC